MPKENVDIISQLPLAQADPLALHPTTISVYAFKQRYSDYLARYPFSIGYLGLKNPFTQHIIKCETDYRLFLREFAYYSFCREFEQKALDSEEAASFASQEARETIALTKKQYREAHDEILAELRSAENIAHEAKLDATAARNSMKQAEERLQKIEKRRSSVNAVFTVILIVCTILAFFIGKGSGKKAGYAEGQVSAKNYSYDNDYNNGQAEDNSREYEAGRTDGYRTGYEAGLNEGYRNGYDDGVDAGYSTGYLYGKQDGASSSTVSSGKSGNGGTSSTRDTPIADTYIGNASSKKFHLPTCSYLPDKSNQVTFDSREDAIAAGYIPCGHCHP